MHLARRHGQVDAFQDGLGFTLFRVHAGMEVLDLKHWVGLSFRRFPGARRDPFSFDGSRLGDRDPGV
ncbi:hypothetical protein GCM10007420_04800 [Glycocaulis albus]|uniref:Uncharacterized protein n=1 Tax=Glycocaulis albus TaxID=1382801 RepID=A0ABQ1XGP0_9PROT|nr:hypothetical protein GCM10007420_04800 [Glycocaulis albus]